MQNQSGFKASVCRIDRSSLVTQAFAQAQSETEAKNCCKNQVGLDKQQQGYQRDFAVKFADW
jgi:hypothetical protein